jgi:hypothetical protein
MIGSTETDDGGGQTLHRRSIDLPHAGSSNQFWPVAKPAPRGSVAAPQLESEPGKYRLQAMAFARPGSGTRLVIG